MIVWQKVRRAAAGVAVCAVVLAPTAAHAISVSYSSDRGSGWGSITWTGTKNFNYDVNVRSSTGVPVYTERQGFRDNAPDSSRTRMHGDTTTTSSSGQRFLGTVNGSTGEIGWSGVYLRHCENKAFVSDYCGNPSGYRRP